jgi:regulator of replication initiation timing
MAELAPRDARIAKLEALLEAALERIAHLEEENRQLREENRQLKERLNLNPSNSSWAGERLRISLLQEARHGEERSGRRGLRCGGVRRCS